MGQGSPALDTVFNGAVPLGSQSQSLLYLLEGFFPLERSEALVSLSRAASALRHHSLAHGGIDRILCSL